MKVRKNERNGNVDLSDENTKKKGPTFNWHLRRLYLHDSI